jgi:hypothetical protein
MLLLDPSERIVCWLLLLKYTQASAVKAPDGITPDGPVSDELMFPAKSTALSEAGV